MMTNDAMPTADAIESSALAVLASVTEEFGIEFREVETGGGCMALEARLESGHWIVATDESLFSLRYRLVLEAVAGEDCDDDYVAPGLGWSVGIYPNGNSHGDDSWFGVDSIVDVTDYEAYGDALPVFVGRALSDLVSALASGTDIG